MGNPKTKSAAQKATDMAQATGPAPKTYRVTGPHPVHDTPPGATFTKLLDPGQETFLIDTGHIQIIEPDTPDANRANSAEKE